MQSRKRAVRRNEVNVSSLIRLQPAQARRLRRRKRSNPRGAKTRLVLIGDRLWYLPLAKKRNPRLASQLAGTALGVLLIYALVAADVMLLFWA
jgi:hypothetical protein